MGVGPTHNCIVMFEGEALPTVLPGSVLDCEQRRCKSRAEEVRREAAVYPLEYIESMIEECQAAVRRAMDNWATWELYREAARRKLT